MQNYLWIYRKKTTLLFLLGIILSLFLKSSLKTEWKVFLSDIFFCVSIVFLLYSIWQFILTVGFFNGMIFGAKCLKDLIYSRIGNSSSVKEDYVNFVKKRKKQGDILMPLLLSGLFLTTSILVSIII